VKKLHGGVGVRSPTLLRQARTDATKTETDAAQKDAVGPLDVMIRGGSKKRLSAGTDLSKHTERTNALMRPQAKAKRAVIVSEASSVPAIHRSIELGADKIRVDVDAFLLDPSTLRQLRRYLSSKDGVERRALLERILASVRAQAEKSIRAAKGLPVRVAIGNRPPSGYFPRSDAQLARVAEELDQPLGALQSLVEDLGSGNSKLGLRGCRWAVADPALFAALGRAVFEAVAAMHESGEGPTGLEIVIPAVSLPGEFSTVRDLYARECEAVAQEFGTTLTPAYGAGIESAAGALSAAELSESANFFEYSLHELTETLYGLSRDDARTFLPQLLQAGAYGADPFTSPSADVVAKIVKVAQGIAGTEPNTFPSSLRGEAGRSALGFTLAAAAGVQELVVPAEDVLRVRAEHAAAADASNTPGDGQMAQTTVARLRVKELRASSVSMPQSVSPLELVESILAEMKGGRLSAEDALLRIPPSIADSLNRPVLAPPTHVPPLATAIGASPGCGVGRIALSAAKAAEYQASGEPYVLVVNEVHSEEVSSVRSSQALLSVEGGRTSHSAIVAANCGAPCVIAEKVRIQKDDRTVFIGGLKLAEGDWLSLDGTKGIVYAGKIETVKPSESPALAKLMQLADAHRRLKVLANADTPEEVAAAFRNGADGVGLVRTEHMFFEPERLACLQSAILSGTDARGDDIARLEEEQFVDFERMLTTAGDKKITFRLLDPPLYEFLPHDADGLRALAVRLGVSASEVADRVNAYQEADSLLGLRGVRLGATRPDLEAMQIRALARAYVAAFRKTGRASPLRVMVPMLSTGDELAAARLRIERVLLEAEQSSGMKIPLELGAMIETPSAALDAGAIAQHASFFSYGTNDLTQLTLGYGRNVAMQIVPVMLAKGVLSSDPTAVLDPKVSALIAHAESSGRGFRPKLESGVCGGQATDAKSIRSIEALKLDYVSVPPGQVASVRLAAAQAAILARRARAR
jgi:phosphoenolpyruvate synthase/pyruvate phosphate dikinase